MNGEAIETLQPQEWEIMRRAVSPIPRQIEQGLLSEEDFEISSPIALLREAGSTPKDEGGLMNRSLIEKMKDKINARVTTSDIVQIQATSGISQPWEDVFPCPLIRGEIPETTDALKNVCVILTKLDATIGYGVEEDCIRAALGCITAAPDQPVNILIKHGKPEEVFRILAGDWDMWLFTGHDSEGALMMGGEVVPLDHVSWEACGTPKVILLGSCNMGCTVDGSDGIAWELAQRFKGAIVLASAGLLKTGVSALHDALPELYRVSEGSPLINWWSGRKDLRRYFQLYYLPK